jgi:hypothetical protein
MLLEVTMNFIRKEINDNRLLPESSDHHIFFLGNVWLFYSNLIRLSVYREIFPRLRPSKAIPASSLF